MSVLLNSPKAKELYEKYAKEQPIFDYHSHVSAEEIFCDRHYSNICELWLESDHYKWRLMRMCGVDERYITGEAEDFEKFFEFARILPRCVGNPVYNWCHMELKKYFGYDGVLNSQSAKTVWDICKEKLSDTNFGVRKILEMSNVKFVGTTNSPCEDLEYHKRLAEEELPFCVSPTFRPDEFLNIEKADFPDKIAGLAAASGVAVDCERTFKCALRKRMNYFAACGCLSADHGCDYIRLADRENLSIDRIFKKALDGAALCEDEVDMFKFQMLVYLAHQYKELGWVMQIHFNCIRNPNTHGYESIGADAGFDCIRRRDSSQDLARLLGEISHGGLPKMILYSLDPSDNTFLDTLTGSFAGGQPLGRVAHGAAWWFNDTRFGMENHIRSLSSVGVIGNFLGMLTDSRSFLSYVRHDYFRRVLCRVIAENIELYEYSGTDKELEGLFSDICFNNAKKFFERETDI